MARSKRLFSLNLLLICQGKNKVRFFVVNDRKAETLTAKIQAVVQPGSVIVTDEWM